MTLSTNTLFAVLHSGAGNFPKQRTIRRILSRRAATIASCTYKLVDGRNLANLTIGELRRYVKELDETVGDEALFTLLEKHKNALAAHGAAIKALGRAEEAAGNG